MRRDEVLCILRAHWSEIQAFGVKSLSLFGSVARDEATAESDIDVLAEFKGPATFDGYTGLMIFLEDLLRRKIDLVTPAGIKPRLQPYIDRDLLRVA